MGDPLVWFVISVTLLLIISRKDLSLSLIVGGIVLGITTISPNNVLDSLATTITTPSYLLLSCAMALFPVLGAMLQESGGLDTLVTSFNIGKKAFLAGSAAFIGMLPVPGGALLSAPLVKKAAGDIPHVQSFAINIWFRHILILIYPLSPALIVPASIASLSVYTVIPYLVPFFVLFIILGYFSLLKGIKDEKKDKFRISIKDAKAPLFILLLAPCIDGLGSHFISFVPSEAITFVAVVSSVVAAIVWARIPLKRIGQISRNAKPQKFFFIIMSMYVFIDIFTLSGAGERIGELGLPVFFHCVVLGFLLAFFTGRTQLSASVVIPTYIASYSLTSMSPLVFSLTFVSIFLGYVLSPLHPCISVSLEYFDTSLDSALRKLAPQTLTALLITAVAFVLLI